MVPASRVGAEVLPTDAAAEHLLHGADATPGIVAVDADSSGRVRVWQRAGATVQLHEARFPSWFLTTSLELLAHLPAQHLAADALRGGADWSTVTDGLTVVTLDAPGRADEDVYRYLVLTDHLAELETTLVETANKRDGGEAQRLEDLRGLVLAWHPIEQYLILSGRTYFKQLVFDDLRRLQFDLETTGLDEERDRIFMISLRDNQGWRESLDTGSLSEAALLRRFVELVQERDPDVLENHNIFAFDLSFLVRRAARLRVRLGLGRDGSEPRLESDVFDSGERAEPFLRWRVVGREVIDTQHAVRRYAASAPDLRRHGLKEAARYFGFAAEDREYVPGAEVWPTYQTDPARIRRYAAHDVDEVDGLARRLLPTAFELAQLVPRAYERIAANAGPTALWEPLLVRAYLQAGRAIPAPLTRQQRPASPRAELLVRGVVAPAVHAQLRPLLPSVLATAGLHAPNDELAVLPTVTGALLRAPQASARVLAEAAPAYLAGQGLFADPATAGEATEHARHSIDRLLDDLRRCGCTIVEVESEQVLCATPATWDAAAESALREAAAGYLPAGVQLTFAGPYQAVYARSARTSILLGRDGSVTLTGNAFRPGRLERFGEAFVYHAAPLVLTGAITELRRLFLETIHRLRTAQLPLEELCVQVTLHKSPQQYRRGGTHEEPYEVLLGAGVRSWRVGQRIRYFHARGGEPRLLQEGDGASAAEADADYYVQRLSSLYAQHFAQAFRREDFPRVFGVPSGAGPFTVDAADLEGIAPVATAV